MFASWTFIPLKRGEKTLSGNQGRLDHRSAMYPPDRIKKKGGEGLMAIGGGPCDHLSHQRLARGGRGKGGGGRGFAALYTLRKRAIS